LPFLQGHHRRYDCRYGIILPEERYLERKFGDQLPALQIEDPVVLVAIVRRPVKRHWLEGMTRIWRKDR